ncbi:MAG TPA: hypothetical protein VFH27_16000 [Longimicrobiaceae bacterium]|nr:hypothetical protein [Longimicrobiaceae bacterium]
MRFPSAHHCAALLLLAAAPFAARTLHAQTAAPADTLNRQVRLFLDCSGFYCEPDFYQTEIPFVSHVRDRSDADVHVLVTRQETGTGATEYTLAFLGQGRFQRADLTLRRVVEANASEDRARQTLAQAVKLGLARYVAESPQGTQMRVTYEAPAQKAAAATAADPWNHWTFRVDGNAFLNGEESYANRSLYTSAVASRTTALWKLRLGTNVSESRSRYDVDSATTYVNSQRGRSAEALLVRSVTGHLSVGATASVSRSTYLNQRLAARVAPAVELDLFPYSESTRRQVTLRYSVGPAWFTYEQPTIFERTSDRRMQHTLRTSVVARQPWGSVNASVQGQQFLDNLRQNRLEVGGGTELNLVRGLSLNVYGQYERLRDQLYLPAGEASEDEILLRRRQLATGFSYYTSIGLSYTFGSRFNTIVNPRFSN